MSDQWTSLLLEERFIHFTWHIRGFPQGPHMWGPISLVSSSAWPWLFTPSLFEVVVHHSWYTKVSLTTKPERKWPGRMNHSQPSRVKTVHSRADFCRELITQGEKHRPGPRCLMTIKEWISEPLGFLKWSLCAKIKMEGYGTECHLGDSALAQVRGAGCWGHSLRGKALLVMREKRSGPENMSPRARRELASFRETG